MARKHPRSLVDCERVGDQTVGRLAVCGGGGSLAYWFCSSSRVRGSNDLRGTGQLPVLTTDDLAPSHAYIILIMVLGSDLPPQRAHAFLLPSSAFPTEVFERAFCHQNLRENAVVRVVLPSTSSRTLYQAGYAWTHIVALFALRPRGRSKVANGFVDVETHAVAMRGGPCPCDIGQSP